MPQTYFSLITNQGLIKEAASNEPGGTAIDLTEMAVGDSNGAYYDPDGSETALANEVHRVTLTHVVVDENNTNQLIVEAVLDEIIGPFYIREVGIFDSNGDLFAIGKYPETFKPNLPEGSGKRLYIRMILGFANSPNVNLVINNDIALDPNFGTDVNNALAERLVKTNNLSDLDNLATTRNNLEVYSKNEINNLQKKNFLINGNFDVWQRGASFNSNLSGGSYIADRFRFSGNGGTAGSYNISRKSFDPGQLDVPNNPRYYLNWQQNTAPSELHNISQRIEGVDFFSGKEITFSFWARINSGTFSSSIKINQNFGSGGSNAVTSTIIQNFTPTTSWQQFSGTITIPNTSGKIIGEDSFLEILIKIPDDGVWDIDLAQCQLEKGNIVTNFEYRNLLDEIRLCESYYEKSYNIDTAPGTITNNGMEIERSNDVIYWYSIRFKTKKSRPPTVILYNPANGNSGTWATGSGGNVAPSSLQDIGEAGANMYFSTNPSTNVFGHWIADAEL